MGAAAAHAWQAGHRTPGCCPRAASGAASSPRRNQVAWAGGIHGRAAAAAAPRQHRAALLDPGQDRRVGHGPLRQRRWRRWRVHDGALRRIPIAQGVAHVHVRRRWRPADAAGAPRLILTAVDEPCGRRHAHLNRGGDSLCGAQRLACARATTAACRSPARYAVHAMRTRQLHPPPPRRREIQASMRTSISHSRSKVARSELACFSSGRVASIALRVSQPSQRLFWPFQHAFADTSRFLHALGRCLCR